MNEKDAVLALWNKTSGLIDEKLSHAYYDKTFPSTIYGKNGDGTYKIVREGVLYDVPNSLGIELKKGQSIWVTMPCGTNKLKDMYISGVRDGYEITPSGGGSGVGEENVIESISVNGTVLDIDENKNVNIEMPDSSEASKFVSCEIGYQAGWYRIAKINTYGGFGANYPTYCPHSFNATLKFFEVYEPSVTYDVQEINFKFLSFQEGIHSIGEIGSTNCSILVDSAFYVDNHISKISKARITMEDGMGLNGTAYLEVYKEIQSPMDGSLLYVCLSDYYQDSYYKTSGKDKNWTWTIIEDVNANGVNIFPYVEDSDYLYVLTECDFSNNIEPLNTSNSTPVSIGENASTNSLWVDTTNIYETKLKIYDNENSNWVEITGGGGESISYKDYIARPTNGHFVIESNSTGSLAIRTPISKSNDEETKVSNRYYHINFTVVLSDSSYGLAEYKVSIVARKYLSGSYYSLSVRNSNVISYCSSMTADEGCGNIRYYIDTITENNIDYVTLYIGSKNQEWNNRTIIEIKDVLFSIDDYISGENNSPVESYDVWDNNWAISLSTTNGANYSYDYPWYGNYVKRAGEADSASNADYLGWYSADDFLKANSLASLNIPTTRKTEIGTVAGWYRIAEVYTRYKSQPSSFDVKMSFYKCEDDPEYKDTIHYVALRLVSLGHETNSMDMSLIDKNNYKLCVDESFYNSKYGAYVTKARVIEKDYMAYLEVYKEITDGNRHIIESELTLHTSRGEYDDKWELIENPSLYNETDYVLLAECELSNKVELLSTSNSNPVSVSNIEPTYLDSLWVDTTDISNPKVKIYDEIESAWVTINSGGGSGETSVSIITNEEIDSLFK